jgi:glutamate N-acetyltransferase/amino-acid N-acetyltransferase
VSPATPVLPAGFSAVELEGAKVLVCAGPRDDAAGLLPDEEFAELLWTRQVLGTGRVTAAALVPGTPSRGPVGFADVHALTERLADELGIGAVEVAPVAIGASVVRLATAGGDGYCVAATVAGHPGADPAAVVLTTDATLDPAALTEVLAALPLHGSGARLALASGASGATPTAADVADVAGTAYTRAIAAEGAPS